LLGQRESAVNAPANGPVKINDWQSKVQDSTPVNMDNVQPKTDIPIHSWQDSVKALEQAPVHEQPGKVPTEQEFIDQELAPFKEAAQQQSEAQQAYQIIKKQADAEIARIKGTYGKIKATSGEGQDYPIPPQFRAGVNNMAHDDLHSFATQEGMTPDEAINYLKKLDDSSKLKLKDMMPADNYVLSPDEWATLEHVAKQKYAEKHGTQGADKAIESITPEPQKKLTMDELNSISSR
jgi:hypothetical protein